MVIFFIFSGFDNIFILIISFTFLKIICFFDVLSKPATSCSNPSLILEVQGAPGHAAF